MFDFYADFKVWYICTLALNVFKKLFKDVYFYFLSFQHKTSQKCLLKRARLKEFVVVDYTNSMDPQSTGQYYYKITNEATFYSNKLHWEACKNKPGF